VKPEGRRVVIVGASAAGLRCACRLARLCPNWTITVVEQREIFSYAACGLPYVLAGDIDEAASLRRTSDGALRDPAFFAAVKGVTVLPGRRATDVDMGRHTLRLVGPGGASEHLAWDELVIATGARARRLRGQPEHPRVRSFHVLEDLEVLHAGLRKGQISRVVIVGSGLVGCELCEAFRALWGVDVTLLESTSAPLPSMVDSEIGAVVAATLRRNGVDLRTNVTVDAIAASDLGVEVSRAGARFAGDVVIIAVGVEPEVELAKKAGLSLGSTGAIAVDDRLATTAPHVWAAGDCIELRRLPGGPPIYLPLGSLANRQGRILANVLAGRDDRFEGAVGAAVVKVFGLNVAATGLTRQAADACGTAARSVWVTAYDRAHYWPEAREIVVHLVYERGSGRVLGVQAVGEGEVAKRIDVATQFIRRGASIDELANVEHAYAPPFAPAIEPLVKAACAAQNQEDGVEAARPDGALVGLRVLDVRHDDERTKRPLAAAAATPLEELRAALPLGGDGPWLAVCERGTRAAETVRLLQSAGEEASYLGGGVRLRTLMGLEDGG
jgi:NADPH-dependent 2,4-dienoyl-CoA reductase/sulfur reductase-like enzyme/rhodanese-related sulfurtransferase